MKLTNPDIFTINNNEMRKKLLTLFIALNAFIASNAQLTESFDGLTFPPTGWLSTHTTGTDTTAKWERATAATLGGDLTANTTFNVDPHSGAGMASFRSYDFAAGNGARLFSAVTDLSFGAPHIISFWMHRDNYYNLQDSLSIYINTTQSITGAKFLGKVLRKRSLAPVEAGSDGWYEYAFNIPAGFNSATNYFIFSAVSSFGNSLFIDDVSVKTAPSCGVPVLGGISNYIYAANTASISWTAPAIGTPAGYQWALNTTGVAPASGTAIAGTSLNITGITAGVVNYLFVRTDCGVGNYSNWVNKAFAALPCATITNPLPGATAVPQDVLFSWNAITGATDYNLFLGYTAGSEFGVGSITGTSTPIGGILPEKSYSWYILPSIGAVKSPVVCSSNTFTTGAEPNKPANNACSGAITIANSNTSGNPINGTTLNATLSAFPDPCNGSYGASDDDVWYEFTTDATPVPVGTITITPSTTNGIKDVVALIYEATNCSKIATLTDCADATDTNKPEVVDLVNLTPNTHYFMRIFSYGSDVTDRGNFGIVASAGNSLKGVILPVTLASFSARRSNNVNLLSWSTQFENNSSRFVVERSKDGRIYSPIGEVTAAGSSITSRKYSLTDSKPYKGNNYYRLRIIDKDNQFRLSEIQRLKNDGTTGITVFPNPVRDKLTVSINADKASDGHLIITDISGKAVYSKSVKLIDGNTIVPVELSAMSAGFYLLKIQLKDEVIIQKFNKQ